MRGGGIYEYIPSLREIIPKKKIGIREDIDQKMIKGCERRMIKIENTESELFEAAYFIVRQNASLPRRLKKDDMLKEAVRLTDGKLTGKKAAGRRELYVKLAFFGSGAAISAAVSMAVAFI